MAWFEIHQSLSRHRKTLRAVALLGCDRHAFIGHMVELWWWALDNVPSTGDLGTVLDEEIAGAADWTGDAQRFVSVLTEAGFIDKDANGRRIHQWEEYGGKLTAKRAANKERMKQARAAHVPRTNNARAPFVSAVQESTGEKRTEENIKETTSQEEVVKKAVVSQKPRPPAQPVEKVLKDKVVPLDEAFRQRMIQDYAEVWSEADVLFIIAEAMNHEAQKKRPNKQLYVQGWLRRELERIGGRDGNPRGNNGTSARGKGQGNGASADTARSDPFAKYV